MKYWKVKMKSIGSLLEACLGGLNEGTWAHPGKRQKCRNGMMFSNRIGMVLDFGQSFGTKNKFHYGKLASRAENNYQDNHDDELFWGLRITPCVSNPPNNSCPQWTMLGVIR